jgi:WD40 repeat protein
MTGEKLFVEMRLMKEKVLNQFHSIYSNVNVFSIPQSTATSSPVHPSHTLSGHTSFVYSLAMLPDGALASSGEDRSVRIWKGEWGICYW